MARSAEVAFSSLRYLAARAVLMVTLAANVVLNKPEPFLTIIIAQAIFRELIVALSALFLKERYRRYPNGHEEQPNRHNRRVQSLMVDLLSGERSRLPRIIRVIHILLINNHIRMSSEPVLDPLLLYL